MAGNPMNIPPVSIAAAKAALIEQYADPTLRRRASMLWGTRGVGKSSIVRQVAEHFKMPLVDLRLTTIEPVDIRGAIYADDALAKTVWFPPEFLPPPDQPEGILFLDELTAADQRLQISAYSLILDRRVGNYQSARRLAGDRRRQRQLPRRDQPRHGHGAGRPHVPLQRADRDRRISRPRDRATNFAPEVMAYLKIRPDKLDDTQAQLAGDHLIGASPRGWEDISNVLKSEPVRQRQAAVRAGPHRRGQRRRVLRRAARDPGRHRRGAAAGGARRCRDRGAAADSRSTGCTA